MDELNQHDKLLHARTSASRSRQQTSGVGTAAQHLRSSVQYEVLVRIPTILIWLFRQLRGWAKLHAGAFHPRHGAPPMLGPWCPICACHAPSEDDSGAYCTSEHIALSCPLARLVWCHVLLAWADLFPEQESWTATLTNAVTHDIATDALLHRDPSAPPPGESPDIRRAVLLGATTPR